MDTAKHRFLSVVYQLYSVADGEQTLEEQTSTDRPFEFISGFGIALSAFERNLVGLEKGSTFDFTIPPSEAFGEYFPEGVNKLEREAFTSNGKFDHEHVFPGAVITLVDAEDNRFNAKVVRIEADGVILDANHPFAGKTLNYTGLVRENREATEAEINNLIKQLTSGCGGCCHEHGEACEGEHENQDHCCGHCHH